MRVRSIVCEYRWKENENRELRWSKRDARADCFYTGWIVFFLWKSKCQRCVHSLNAKCLLIRTLCIYLFSGWRWWWWWCASRVYWVVRSIIFLTFVLDTGIKKTDNNRHYRRILKNWLILVCFKIHFSKN